MTRTALLTLLSLGAAPTLALALQTDRTVPRAGRWLPREVNFTGDLTAAQRAEAMATLEKIERILKQVPEVATPAGYEIVPRFVGGARQQGTDVRELPGGVVEYSLALAHYVPTRATAPGTTSCIVVTINERQWGRLRDAEGRPIYIEPNRGTPSTNPDISDSRVPPKATQVYGALWNAPRQRSGVNVVYVTAGELPWKPVSREAFYKANVLDLEGPDGEKMAPFRAALTKTPYQEFLEGAAQRQKDRETAFAQLKGILPDSVIAKTWRTQEDAERELGERLKKDEDKHRQENSKALSGSFEWRDNMNAELARMTPEERRMPTYINNTLDHGPKATGWTITADDTPPAWRVFTPDYDFYRARRSPVEVRSITVSMTTSFSCGSPNVRRATWQAYHTLDWAAINNLLETPR